MNSTITLKMLLDTLHVDPELSTDSELSEAVKLIMRVQKMDSGQRDVIRAAYLKGPLEDGDVTSKSARDILITDGFISKIVVNGQDGFNACTYKGRDAYKLFLLTMTMTLVC